MMKIIDDGSIHPHEIFSKVIHRCVLCEKKCIKENDEGMGCERSNFVGELVVKVGGFHK